MPRLQKGRCMLCHKTCNVVQLMSLKAPIFCMYYRIKPKFGDQAFSFYVNMRRLPFIRTEKDETIGAILKHCRHK